MLGGFDIGGTKCAVILAEQTLDDVKLIYREEFKTEGTPESVIDKMCDMLTLALTLNGYTVKDLEAIGISCGGPLNSKKGLILSPPNLLGWDNIEIVKIVKNRFNKPAFLCNDADACALAEWKYGAGKGYENVIFLTFGSGFGAGMILNGKLYSGTTDSAGEIGHVRLKEFGPVAYGKAGSCEGFCSGNGIAQLARDRILEKLQMGESVSFVKNKEEALHITTKQVGIAAEHGDKFAISIFEEAGKYFGQVLAILVDLLNPEVIIAGGVYMRQHKIIDKTMREVLDREALLQNAKTVKILPAKLDEKIGDYASISIAINGLKKE